MQRYGRILWGVASDQGKCGAKMCAKMIVTLSNCCQCAPWRGRRHKEKEREILRWLGRLRKKQERLEGPSTNSISITFAKTVIEGTYTAPTFVHIFPHWWYHLLSMSQVLKRSQCCWSRIILVLPFPKFFGFQAGVTGMLAIVMYMDGRWGLL